MIAVDTHRFQPIQLGSEWVEKVDQLTNRKRLIPNRTRKKPNLSVNCMVWYTLIRSVLLRYIGHLQHSKGSLVF